MTFGVDSPRDISALSKLGAHGESAGNIQRDLMKLFKHLKAPEPERIRTSVFKKEAGAWRTAMEEVSVFLPHDWFECIASHDLMDPIFGAKEVPNFWKQVSDKDPRLFMNPMKRVTHWKEKFIPFLVHGDGAPHHKHDSIQVSSFKSMLSIEAVNTAMLLLAGLPEAMRCTEKRCNDRRLPFLGDTDDFLGHYYVWSWNAVFEGKHPSTDPWKRPFAAGSRRATLAGKWLDEVHQMRGCIWRAPADCAHLSHEYGLPSHSSTELCMCCPGNDSDIPWRDFSANAVWKSAIFGPQQLLERPMCRHWMLQISGFSAHCFVYDPMHCIEIGPGGIAVANIMYDLLYKIYTGFKGERLQRLFKDIQDSYDALGITDNKISKLEYSYFSTPAAPHQNYPDIMHSAIKARQCRYLIPVMAKLCNDYLQPEDKYSCHRLECLQGLANALDIVDAGGLFLGTELKAYETAMNSFLVHFAALRVLSGDRQQWNMTPKLHYMVHIMMEAKWLSPKAVWCYSGEHMVGNVAALAQSCLSGTPPHMVPETLCFKYRVGKHMQLTNF